VGQDQPVGTACWRGTGKVALGDCGQRSVLLAPRARVLCSTAGWNLAGDGVMAAVGSWKRPAPWQEGFPAPSRAACGGLRSSPAHQRALRPLRPARL